MLELLNQLDGFESTNKIKVLMATNRIDILDAALLRPGRIDRKIEFPNPSESSRVDILRIHSRKMNLVRGIDLQKVADKMGGASGASCFFFFFFRARGFVDEGGGKTLTLSFSFLSRLFISSSNINKKRFNRRGAEGGLHGSGCVSKFLSFSFYFFFLREVDRSRRRKKLTFLSL